LQQEKTLNAVFANGDVLPWSGAKVGIEILQHLLYRKGIQLKSVAWATVTCTIALAKGKVK